jgi:hypothetical protein
VANTGLERRTLLRELPLPTRLVLSCFLGAIGIGYVSALVQLHFNGGAKPGQYIPGPDEAVRTYFGPVGDKPMSRLERLVLAPESEPFNGTGSMRRAFFDRSQGWSKETKRIEAIADEKQRDAEMSKLQAERSGEADAIAAWARVGGDEGAYQKDDFKLPEKDGGWTITKKYLVEEEEGKPANPARVKIKALINARCACCHSKDEEIGGRDKNAEKYPLDECAKIQTYCVVKQSSAMELNKLAQTTHVHLFGFAMMYCLTGLIFSFTSYWGWVRCIIAPAAVVMSVLEISIGWWVGRLDPCPAGATAAFGAITGGVLLVHIFGSLFDMYGKKGRLVLLVLVLAAAVGAAFLERQVVSPFIESEKSQVEGTSKGTN